MGSEMCIRDRAKIEEVATAVKIEVATAVKIEGATVSSSSSKQVEKKEDNSPEDLDEIGEVNNSSKVMEGAVEITATGLIKGEKKRTNPAPFFTVSLRQTRTNN